MSLFQAIDSSASGLTAERLRLDIIANNLANIDSTRTAAGGPYRRQVPVFTAKGDRFGAWLAAGRRGLEPAGTGVQVTGIFTDPAPFKMVYNPSHPDADGQGYVSMPNVDIALEMVDMLTATRAYEANVTAINAAKSMFLRALDIGR